MILPVLDKRIFEFSFLGNSATQPRRRERGISMRRSDLREAARKAAEQRQPKLTKRLCKGEKTATRRMAQVAAVYTVEPYVRTPEDIAGTLGPSPTHPEPSERPRPEDKRVWVQSPQIDQGEHPYGG